MNKEDISVLVDGEATDGDRAALLTALGGDEDGRRTWARYHVIGDVLRAPEATAEPRPAATVTTLPQPSRPSRAPLAGLAIAASVAVLAVVMILRGAPDTPTAGVEVADASVARPLAPATVASLRGAPVEQVRPVGAYDQRLNGYLVNFNEQRARRGVPGVHPYVRIVGFDAE
ncbi:MAG: sigma-E factor negative regulatory protein [Gammaproteobacteria bacterium]